MYKVVISILQDLYLILPGLNFFISWNVRRGNEEQDGEWSIEISSLGLLVNTHSHTLY